MSASQESLRRAAQWRRAFWVTLATAATLVFALAMRPPTRVSAVVGAPTRASLCSRVERSTPFDSATISGARDELVSAEIPSRPRSTSRTPPTFPCLSAGLCTSFLHTNTLATTTRRAVASYAIVYRKRIPRFSSDEPP